MDVVNEKSLQPRVWLVLGKRLGDNNQVLALVNELGVDYEIRNIRHNTLFRLPNTLIGESLVTVNWSKSDKLEPPWPEVIFAVGRRSAPVVRWIKKQTGGKTKLIHIGRPRGPVSWFDLLVTTPQYSVPPADNVIELKLPMVVPKPVDEKQIKIWCERFQDLPKPWIGVLIGGPTWPLKFDGKVARKLVREANELARNTGGSLLVSTSPRTAQDIITTLAEGLDVPHYLHDFKHSEGNPHQAILASADQFIVTSESASLLSDACKSGKPVWIFRLPHWLTTLTFNRQSWPTLGAFLKGIFLTPHKDFKAMHQRLIDGGHAAWLGGKAPAQWAAVPDRMAEVAERARQVIASVGKP